MRTIRRVSLVETATDEIREQILKGIWPVGSRIPPESALSETLQVSRASVREAIRALVHSGLLETRQGDGTFVVSDDDSAVALRRRLERAELTHVTQVRQGLDVIAARQAARHRTDAQLAAIEAALARRRAALAAHEDEAFTAADADFHVLVAEASANPVLADIYRSLSTALRAELRRAACLDTATAAPTDPHHLLVEAIRERDQAAAVDAAVELLAGHVRDLALPLDD
ncbi:FadR/GntR family transcriptional regulator [Streptomyces purpurogeneiscleroticus]|uniref:FadR/GntR family transcriptional regulator n=1 Tax=Streptomyces purpurogeneiscleroticus TaxID=68259 RepID=UPI001CBDD1BF|nr:FCD domain-containing protein [Streptomyces purpurogeneiscleroticus]MBZ4016538.1 GntR family transcriptional regulator [Streptomyces purpurogeneiscleroticus]